jgi:Ca2+-binding EF-hand superfamily protein
MIRLWCVMGVVGAMLLTGARLRAADKPAQPDAETLFKQLDTDKDGKISQKEFQSLFGDPKLDVPARLKDDAKAQEALFKKYDADKDGYISLDEFKTLWKEVQNEAQAEALFKQLDTDKDGKISQKEFQSLFNDPKVEIPKKLKDDPKAQDELFKKADTDKDGYINLDEFKALWKDIQKPASDKDSKP